MNDTNVLTTAHATFDLPPPIAAPEPEVDERPSVVNADSVLNRKRRSSVVRMTTLVIVLILVAICSIFIVRFMLLVKEALTLPYVWRCVALTLLAEVAVLLGWIGLQGFRLFRSLPKFDRVDKTRTPEKKRLLLKPYVNDNSLVAPSDDGRILLAKLRNDENYTGDGSGWVDDFKNFQKSQEAFAQNIVASSARKIAVSTATSRWAVIDMACVAYLSTKMIVDIASNFNRRVSPQQALRLTVRWAANVYLSGEIDEVAKQFGKEIGDFLATHLPVILSEIPLGGTIGKVVGKSAGFLLGRVSEGTANALLAYRLGQRAIKFFEPLET